MECAREQRPRVCARPRTPRLPAAGGRRDALSCDASFRGNPTRFPFPGWASPLPVGPLSLGGLGSRGHTEDSEARGRGLVTTESLRPGPGPPWGVGTGVLAPRTGRAARPWTLASTQRLRLCPGFVPRGAGGPPKPWGDHEDAGCRLSALIKPRELASWRASSAGKETEGSVSARSRGSPFPASGAGGPWSWPRRSDLLGTC